MRIILNLKRNKSISQDKSHHLHYLIQTSGLSKNCYQYNSQAKKVILVIIVRKINVHHCNDNTFYMFQRV